NPDHLIIHPFPTRRSSDLKIARAILSRAPNQRIGVISRIGSRRRFADAAFAAEEGFEVHRWDDGVLDTDTARRVKSVLASMDAADRKSTRLNSSHVKISYA